MPYPSTLSSLTDPQASDRLNNPSHSALHQSENAAIEEIQAFVGTLSSAVGTLVYDIRAAASNGGGHVQTANKGGTGQTSYTKGDVLVATSASVLGKLAVGNDGQAIIADSSVASGVKWGSPSGTRVLVNASVISFPSVTETSVLSTTLPGSTLGTGNAVNATVFVRDAIFNNGASVLVRAIYGGNTVASVMLSPTANLNASIAGTIEYSLLANASANAQRAVLRVNLNSQQRNPSASTSFLGVAIYNSNTASVASGANQIFGVTVRQSVATADDSFIVDGSIVEKIV